MKDFYIFGSLMIFLIAISAVTGTAKAVESDGLTLKEAGVGEPNQRIDIEKVLGLKFSGDIRFRTEYFVQGQDYAPTYVTTPVLWIDHEFRLRVRGRLGVEKVFGEEATAGLRFSTGNGMDPADPYLTLSDGTNAKSVFLDRIHITWTPGFLSHQVGLTVGKMPNPLVFSPITWDEDISPEGAALVLEPIKDTKLTVLYCLMQENGPATIEGSGVDLYVAHFQLQQKLQLPNAEVSFTAGYQYVPNVSAYETGDPGLFTYLATDTNPPGAPLSITYKGMVGDLTSGGLIPDINMVEGLFSIRHKMGDEKIPVQWTFHGACNLNSFNLTAFTNANVAVNHPNANASNAWAFFAKVEAGKPDHRGELAGSFEWGFIEPNAVFSAFSDSDSGAGHNNNTWFKGVAAVGLEEGISLSVGQYLDWRVNYDVMGTTASNVFGTTSRAPILRTQIDLAARL